jgi:protein-S-isoprenylcysteine O-methyltransferase Ste14
MRGLWLFLKNLLFTLLVPGFVVGWVPLRWFERYPHWPAPADWAWPQFAAVILGAIAAGVFLHCQWLFAVRGQGTPAPIDPPKKFVRRGLYKWVRNPMYLAVFTLVGAEALFLQSGHIGVYFVLLVCLIHVWVLLYEEEVLRRNFGAMYEDYRREVPRWLPRKPRPPLQTVPPFPIDGKER